LTIRGVGGNPTIDTSSNGQSQSDTAAIDINADKAVTIENLNLTGSDTYNKNYGVIEAGPLTGADGSATTLTVKDSNITVNDDGSDSIARGIVMAKGGTFDVSNAYFEGTTGEFVYGIYAENAGDNARLSGSTFNKFRAAVQIGGANDVKVTNTEFKDIDTEALIFNTENSTNAFGTIDGASESLNSNVTVPAGIEVTGNTFDTADDAVFFVDENDDTTGPDFDDPPVVTNNDFQNINNYGVAVGDQGFSPGNDVTVTVNATQNWWGDASGPSGLSGDAPGSGAQVDDEVVYTRVDSLGTSSTWLDAADGSQRNRPACSGRTQQRRSRRRE
jgi:hypothetical protein